MLSNKHETGYPNLSTVDMDFTYASLIYVMEVIVCYSSYLMSVHLLVTPAQMRQMSRYHNKLQYIFWQLHCTSLPSALFVSIFLITWIFTDNSSLSDIPSHSHCWPIHSAWAPYRFCGCVWMSQYFCAVQCFCFWQIIATIQVPPNCHSNSLWTKFAWATRFI